VNDAIYQRPVDYDLEHEGDERDVRFYRRLVDRLRPTRVLELACGSARLSLPLTAALADAQFVGIDINGQMLEQARRKLLDAAPSTASRVRLCEGDMRSWTSNELFDLVLVTGSAITHLLTLDDQLAVWRNAFTHLVPGGRFVVDVTMPDLAAYAESLRTPPRALTELDLDQVDPSSGERLVRHRTTRFDLHSQHAEIRFLYDKFSGGQHISRYLSDFSSHVYFPRELHLLYLHTGFEVEAVWADYTFQPPGPGTREIVMCGARPINGRE
jgi:SAM-dependent methyltransferase